MPGRLTSVSSKYVVLLFLIVTGAASWAANEPQFAIKESHRDANGITFQTAAGTMRIEACGDRVIHVVASPTSEIPSPKVPIVTQTCRANNLQVKVGKKETKLIHGGNHNLRQCRDGRGEFLLQRWKGWYWPNQRREANPLT